MKPTFAFENTKVWKFFLQLLRNITFVCAVISIVVMVTAVVLRYIFHKDFVGYEEIILLVALWMYYIGACYATYNETHIRGDMMSQLFKTGKSLKFYWVSIDTFSSVVMAFWVVWGFKWLIWNFKAWGTTTALHIPLFYSYLAIYIGILGLFFLCVFNLIKYIIMKPEDYDAWKKGEV